MILMDRKFQYLNGHEIDTGLNITSRDEHVPEVERMIRTIKDRVRAVYNSLPYQHIPLTMIPKMVFTVIFWLSAFPQHDGVSNTLSPRTIITQRIVDYKLHCHIEFGAYTQIHEEHDNSMVARTTGAITMDQRETSKEDNTF